MSLDTITDAQVAALLTLVKGGVNAELLGTLQGALAIDGVYGHPRPLDILPQLKLPALAIHRKQERRLQRSTKHIERVVTFWFEYIATRASLENLGTRWPLLQAVWDELADVVVAGKHASVSSGANVLQAAGFVDVDVNSAEALYDFAPAGDTLYPYLRGVIVATHRTEIDISALQNLIDLDAEYELMGESPPLEQPLIEEIITAI